MLHSIWCFHFKEGNPCLSSSCENGGQCTIHAGGIYTCSCLPGYIGSHCQKVVLNVTRYGEDKTTQGPSGHLNNAETDVCRQKPCKHGGQCTSLSGGSYSCTCATGYIGQRCEEADPCSSVPCMNGGHCTIHNSSSYTCSCLSQYRGSQCQIVESSSPAPQGGVTVRAPHPCASEPCHNGGTCQIQTDITYICVCDIRYIGHDCEVVESSSPAPQGGVTVRAPHPCASEPCHNGGTCQMQTDITYICVCDIRYIGHDCEELDACFLEPCKHGGLCTARGRGRYMCACVAGYMGQHCEDGDPCMSQPCMNDGRCTIHTDGVYTCSCLSEYRGSQCQRYSPETLTENRRNDENKRMSNLRTDENKRKSHHRNDEKKPHHRSNENNHVFRYGTNEKKRKSHHRNDEKKSHHRNNKKKPMSHRRRRPIREQHTAALHQKQSSLKEKKTSSQEKDPDTVRQNDLFVTLLQYRRHNHTEMSPLHSACTYTPCLNGGCCLVLSGVTYRCICTEGFDGKHCEESDGCLSAPCVNSGNCTSFRNGTYACDCQLGYSGSQCEFLDACLSNPCEHSGRCLDLHKGGFVCACHKGFSGRQCENKATAVQPPSEAITSAVTSRWSNKLDHVLLVNVGAIVIFALVIVFFLGVFFVIYVTIRNRWIASGEHIAYGYSPEDNETEYLMSNSSDTPKQRRQHVDAVNVSRPNCAYELPTLDNVLHGTSTAHSSAASFSGPASGYHFIVNPA
ncbi:hypothetical protein LSAT2_015129 [Lamellibrachia satsuma]|nr:hypothetical protein LSAT2_015129 [Lamellibrachia satsuma]